MQKDLKVILDLQGPKIRIGTFREGLVWVGGGSTFVLDSDSSAGDSDRVYFPHPELFSLLAEGTELLLDDGKVKVLIEGRSADKLITKVIVGGDLSDKKGVNIPGVSLPINPITDKDLHDLSCIDEINPDFVAISFVQRARDIEYARTLVPERIGLIAKIEKPSAAYAFLDEIIDAAAIVMIARGDLGVEVPFETLPEVQRRIASRCLAKGKPFIVATQALESMRESQTPTRAEIIDVDNSVRQGAFALMLSAETASGKYPEKAVQVMSKIICAAEESLASH
jgi:pyruvate kinase